MARVFSWKLNDSTYGYLVDEKGEKGFHIGKKMSNVEKAAETVSGYTESEYKDYFNQLQKSADYLNATIEGNYRDYYSVTNSIIMLTGKDGVKGDTGKGEKGEKGEKGDTGAAGKGRNVVCYCGVDSGFTPTRKNITGGKLNTSNWHITWPTDPDGICIWGDNNEFGTSKVVYMSNADFDNDGNLITRKDDSGEYTWSTPIRISGEKGDNGADGDCIEFIYKLAKDRKETIPENPTTAKLDGFIGGDTGKQCNFGKSKETNDFVPEGWTDSPCGISQDTKVEYMCQRTKEGGNGKTWSDWNGPTLWASWGEDGNDGDGIEYIFAITQDYGKTAIQTKLPKSTDAALKNNWQDPEIFDYIRENNLLDKYSPWTDDPIDVEKDEPYEWVSIRRRKDNTWGEFGEPKLWAHYGKDGIKGNDGTSLNIKGKYATLGALLKDIHTDSEKFPPKVGDAYAIGEGDNVHMWVWMELDSSNTNTPYVPNDTYDYDNTNFRNYKYDVSGKSYWFVDCGAFKGESGLTAYVHIKYAKKWTGGAAEHKEVTITNEDGAETVDLCFTTNTGETPGPYIAIYTDNIEADRADFSYYCGDNEEKKVYWTRFRGDDGQSYGQEQIFCRTQSNTPPSSKKIGVAAHGYESGETILNINYTGNVFTTADYIPSEGAWTDTPLGIVNGIYNFEWVSTRKLITSGENKGEWSYFSAPALYNEAVDTPTFQIEYSNYTGTSITGLESANAYTTGGVFDETGWRNASAQSKYGPWTDDSTNATWQATANGYYKNSYSGNVVWGDWIVTRCRGANRFTSFVFTSAAPGEDLSNETPTGGTYAEPKPKAITVNGRTYAWTDAPSTTSGVIIWMTKAEFSSDSPNGPIGSWSKPKAMTDSADFEVIYSAYKAPNAIPDGFKKDSDNPVNIDSTWLNSANNVGWFDEANQCKETKDGKSGATPVWMATNTYSNGSWGGWQISKIKGEDGINGESIFTSFAFAVFSAGTSVDFSKTTLNGGTYENPVPNSSIVNGVNIKWVDSPQSTSETDQIWMTWAQFSSKDGIKTSWATPKLMNDTADFEVMYSAWDDTANGNVLEELPDGFKKDSDNPVNIDGTWLNSANNVGWFDEVKECQGYSTEKKGNDGESGATPVWMATNKFNHGKWGGWQYFKVKGEKGDPGENGTSDVSLQYLKEIFENVDNGNGAVLREFIGVKNGSADESKIVAFMNGSSAISGNNGTLMIAAGSDGLMAEKTDGTGEKTIQVDKANSAKFRVYSDGTMYAQNANISGAITATTGVFSGVINAESGVFNGTINASNGTIGGYNIEGNNLVGSGSEGTVEIQPEEICFYDSNKDFAVGINGKYYTSFREFTNSEGGSSGSSAYTVTGISRSGSLMQTSSGTINFIENGGAIEEFQPYKPFYKETSIGSITIGGSKDVKVIISGITHPYITGAFTANTTMPDSILSTDIIYSCKLIIGDKEVNLCEIANLELTGSTTGYTSITNGIKSKTYSDKAINSSVTVPPGTYSIKVRECIVIGYGPATWDEEYYNTNILNLTANLTVKGSSIFLKWGSVEERTEIFANGFCYAATMDDYVGVIRQNATSRADTSKNNLIFEASCGTAKIRVDGRASNVPERLMGNVGDRYFTMNPILIAAKILSGGTIYHSGSQQNVTISCTKTDSNIYTIKFSNAVGAINGYPFVQPITSGATWYVSSLTNSECNIVASKAMSFYFILFAMSTSSI